ncbi:MAG: elongation factor G domain IV [Candidatus Parvarchaeum acidiphilum ARMAN-4]|uniref:Elongation factor 2 n=1 Tax=Candidatus Parvarchaeum acidiphilum ARMAN-4 TaxID=662760 RepID=D2EG23_PARA4|nr:MAG: elongation factor G domain IV [Candidatus Parvarchaeum acidiphilum ARMAN-4]
MPTGKIKTFTQENIELLIKAGMTREEAKSISAIYGENMIVDSTRGIIHIGEVIEMCIESFNEVMKEGPQAREEVRGVKIVLTDMVLHEDAIHRGPAQVIPAVRDAIKDAMLQANPIILEPIQILRVDLPMANLSNISALIQSKRGIIDNVKDDGDKAVITAEMPVASTFNFTNELRSGTEGRGSWSLAGETFKKLPRDIQPIIIKQIRDRKGLEPMQ